jgi:hypothetical protein
MKGLTRARPKTDRLSVTDPAAFRVRLQALAGARMGPPNPSRICQRAQVGAVGLVEGLSVYLR